MVSLPKIDLPTYDVILTSRGVTKFRPFTIKEQKILMMGLESKDFESSFQAIKQVLSNCLLDQVNVDELPMIDIELLFLAVRSKSMGEKLQLYFKCNQEVLVPATGNTKPCGMIIEMETNIDQIDPITPVEKKVQLTQDIIVEMKYPTFSLINLLQKRANTMIEAEYVVIGGCMNKIYHGNQVINISDASVEEVMGFIEGLSEEHYNKLSTWVRNTPKIRKQIEKTCPKCGKHHKITLEGLADFFM